MNENEIQHLLEETISGSETSDCGIENVPLFNISVKNYCVNDKSPEIPLLHSIHLHKDIEDGVKKKLDFYHPETDKENSDGGSHFYSENYRKRLNSCTQNDFPIDSSALIDRNLVEGLINDLYPDIPTCESFQLYQKSNNEKDLRVACIEDNNPEIETFNNEIEINDNHKIVHEVDGESFADAESERTAREYSQLPLIRHSSLVDDIFDPSQPVFISSSSQEIFDSPFKTKSNKSLIQNSVDFSLSSSGELFSTQGNKDADADICLNVNNLTKNCSSKVFKNAFFEKTDSFKNYENDETIFHRESSNEILIGKNNSFATESKADENEDSSKISPSLNSISEEGEVNYCNEKSFKSSDKTDIENCQGDLKCAPSPSLKIILTQEQNMQVNLDNQDFLSIMDQNDESTQSLSDRDSNSPSMLVPNSRYQKEKTKDENSRNFNSKLEECSNVFDYVKTIKVVHGSFKKINVNKFDSENNANNNEVSTMYSDSNIVLEQIESPEYEKIDNVSKRIFKSKSTRCFNRFQVPWKNVNEEEKKFNSGQNQENNNAKEKPIKNNLLTSNRTPQKNFQNAEEMDDEKEAEEQINITDLNNFVNNMHSESNETNNPELEIEPYTENITETQNNTEYQLTKLHEENILDIHDRLENIAETQNRKPHLTELHEENIADIHDTPDNDACEEKYFQYISDSMVSRENKNLTTKNSKLFLSDGKSAFEGKANGKETTEFLIKGASEAPIQIVEIEVANESMSCKENQDASNTELCRNQTRITKKKLTEVASIANLNQEQNLSLKFSESFTIHKMSRRKRKQKTCESKVYAKKHPDICTKTLLETSKEGEEIKIKEEYDSHSDSDIEILEEFVVRKVKLYRREISERRNRRYRRSEFMHNSSLQNKIKEKGPNDNKDSCKRKLRNYENAVYAKNHSDTSKEDKEIKIKDEYDSYSDSDIEILEETIVRKLKFDREDISKRRNKRYRPLDFISNSSPKKKIQDKGPKGKCSRKKQVLSENFEIYEKEKNLLEKIESKLHHVAKILVDKRCPKIRKKKALILLKEISPILDKARIFCNNFQMNSDNHCNFSTETFSPFKLKQVEDLYSNLMNEMHKSTIIQKQDSDKGCFSNYLTRSVGSKDTSKFISPDAVKKRSTATNSSSSPKNFYEHADENCNTNSAKRRRKICHEILEFPSQGEININQGKKHSCNVLSESLLNKRNANISTRKQGESENITLISKKNPDITANKEHLTQKFIFNCNSTIDLNDSWNLLNEIPSFEKNNSLKGIATEKESGIKSTRDLNREQNDLGQNNSSAILKFGERTGAFVDSVSSRQVNSTNKDYCNRVLSTAKNSSSMHDDESNMIIDEIQNSLDETQSLVGLDKDLVIIPVEREDTCIELQINRDRMPPTTSATKSFNTGEECNSISLNANSFTESKKREQRNYAAPILKTSNTIKQTTFNKEFLPSKNNYKSDKERIITNSALTHVTHISEMSKNYEENAGNSMESLLQDSSNGNLYVKKKINVTSPINNVIPNDVTDCNEKQNTQPNTLQGIIHITDTHEENSGFKEVCSTPIKNLNGKNLTAELNTIFNAKKLIDIKKQSMPSKDTEEILVTSINTNSIRFIQNRFLQSISPLKENMSSFCITPITNKTICCNINSKDCTTLKNPQNIPILNEKESNEVTTATASLNNFVHNTQTQNISNIKGNSKNSYFNISKPDIINSCNSDLNHCNPLKNILDQRLLNENKQHKLTTETSTLSIGDMKNGFKIQKVAKRKTNVPIIKLIQHNLLTPGENVLSVHTAEKILFGSLGTNGKIISNNKTYSSPRQWCREIPNFHKNAQKPSKSKSCYDRIYYQGRTLSYFVDIYHQGLENQNTSQGIEEPSIVLNSSTGLEVIQRSTAPHGISSASIEAFIPRPNVLNLLKMKLLLIEDNEVGHISETVHWEDIDKWD